MAAHHRRARRRRAAPSRRLRRLGYLVSSAGLLAEALAIRRLGYPLAGDVVVRCRRDHLFTTIWVPGVSLKALRLGWWRGQWCPAGRHWSFVTPVRRADLTADEQRLAARTRDVRVP